MSKKYYISFLYNGGYGDCVLTVKESVGKEKDISDIKNYIQTTYKVKSVVVLNLIELAGDCNE